MSGERPIVVDVVEGALADWLGSFTAHGDLLAEMADACAVGAAWSGAIAATASRRAGWSDGEAIAWGVAVGALAGSLEGTRRSLRDDRDRGTTASDGPARPLLAADALIAAAYEALASLGPDRLADACRTLESTLGDGGPWGTVARGELRGPAWPALVPLAVGPATSVDGGPWLGYGVAWRRAFVEGSDDGAGSDDFPDAELWERPDADRATRALFERAARAARRGGPPEASPSPA